MSQWIPFIIPGIIVFALIYFITILIFDLLLRGFTPFIPSRPWVVKQIMDELNFTKTNPKIIALSSGRSGFLYALSKKYTDASLAGVESELFPFFVAVVQKIIRRTHIRILLKSFRRVDVGDVDLIYCHLTPEELRNLGKKFKFECKPGALVISTGFNIPYLEPKKIVPLEDRKGKFDFFSKNQNLFQSQYKKYKKEKKAYFYEI